MTSYLRFMKLLLVEDEHDLAANILSYLKGNDFVCEWASNYQEALDKINAYDYDCILLDLTLPDGNGFELLKVLKTLGKTEGVIIISAKETLETRIESLMLGADDYLTKPFHLSELTARIQALIRRKYFTGNNTVSFREIEIDLLSKKVKVNGKDADFTKTEMDLLLYLVANRSRVVSRASIAEHLSGDMADMLDNHDFVYAHIKNLKKKLRDAGANDYIKTVYGLGYQWQL